MRRYRTGRALASTLVWGGFLGVGLGVAMVAVAVAQGVDSATSGAGGVALMFWGAAGALVGHLCRAIFDIADHVLGPVAESAAVPVSEPFPLAMRDPG